MTLYIWPPITYHGSRWACIPPGPCSEKCSDTFNSLSEIALFVSVRSGEYRTVTILLILLIAGASNYWPLVMMRTNNSKRSVPTNRLPDWDLGVDYVEINAREKSKQILLNHCRKKYSFPCLGASNFDQERQKSGFQRRCNAHIGPNDIENSSSSDWRRPCIDCLSELVGNLAVCNAAPHFGDHPRYEEQVLGRLQKWPLSRLICTPYQKMTPEIQFWYIKHEYFAKKMARKAQSCPK